MSLAIGGVGNPFLKPNGINPLTKNQGAQSGVQAENQQNQIKSEAAGKPESGKKTNEQTDEELKKYSQAMTSYGMAMLAMQSKSSSGTVGVETSGSVG